MLNRQTTDEESNQIKMKRRVTVKVKDLREIGESIAWCYKHGVDGFLRFYEDLLCSWVNAGRVDSIDVDTFVGNGPWTRMTRDER